MPITVIQDGVPAGIRPVWHCARPVRTPPRRASHHRSRPRTGADGGRRLPSHGAGQPIRRHGSAGQSTRQPRRGETRPFRQRPAVREWPKAGSVPHSPGEQANRGYGLMAISPHPGSPGHPTNLPKPQTSTNRIATTARRSQDPPALARQCGAGAAVPRDRSQIDDGNVARGYHAPRSIADR